MTHGPNRRQVKLSRIRCGGDDCRPPSSPAAVSQPSQVFDMSVPSTDDVGRRTFTIPRIGCVAASSKSDSGLPRASRTPLKVKRKKEETDNDLVVIICAEMTSRQEAARSRFEEMMAMAQIERQRDERRFRRDEVVGSAAATEG